MRGAATVEQTALEELMDKAWPALEREEAGQWVLRASEGVTQRANSVWPRVPAQAGPEGIAHSVQSAAQWYRSRRLPLIFQVFDDPRSAELNAVLDGQRFTRQSETRIMVRDAADVPGKVPTAGVEVSEEPSQEWLNLWWSVDGRGGEAELSVARRILTACPSLYALVRDDDGVPAAVGRLALVNGWGGIYSMATSAAHRRRGHGTQVVEALLQAGRERNLGGFWLLVTAANHAARGLYGRVGFTDYGGYLYRQAPLKRAPGGC
ncbi:GNAT family N-acetyltransferase [Paenarthrobacter nicotinovorans]|uniref:GNAT family N-acetyltransferase n=1 Tax=Paenarthrobacter nicotinovorans TaxID=29320 RepID=UPI0027850CEA|nr:GNAT family N-acetyltransferase [Paenarthrobacter nicotinovorans]MDP9934280.1 ribosomal protein S18 acetylase RimI-like enzyme [Paenarthrobacter nicotinovorans]